MSNQQPIINIKATEDLRQAVKIAAVSSGFKNVSEWLTNLINAQPEVKKALKVVKSKK